MSLTCNQKRNLGVFFGLATLTGFIAGLIVLVIWVGSTSYVQRFCSGTTQLVVTTDHGGEQSTSIKFNAPACR